MALIDGNLIADQILEELKEEVANISDAKPTIAFIRIGENPSSISYVNKKQESAEKIGIQSQLILLPESVTRKELFSQIELLNNDASIHGILIQSPLPSHISETEAFNRVLPEKDVDGFSAINLGKLCQEDESGFIACTPLGIVELLKRNKIKTEGKNIVVVGRSIIVGKPAALLMLRKAMPGNATVTICHSHTKNLKEITQKADILIAAIGKPHIITADMINPGSVVIDVGNNRLGDPSKKSGFRIVGDVDFEEASKVAGKITPVPGGVGPMTVAMLMRNTLKAYKQQTEKAS